MLRRDRPDGTRLDDLPRLRVLMPHLLPRRNDATVQYEQRLDLSATMAWLKHWNDGPGRPPMTLHHVLMAALARTLHERPHMNRFVMGRRLWQRREVVLSWLVIKTRDDSGRMSAIKRSFAPGTSLTDMRATIEAARARARDLSEATRSEREIAFISRLPGPLAGVLARLEALADSWNLLPARLIDFDPLHASAMVSNLGSIGIDACWHHLFENGTLSIFLTIGRAGPMAFMLDGGEISVRPGVLLRYTFDERVADGWYAAQSMARLQELAQSPWLLERPEDEGPGAAQEAGQETGKMA